MPKKRAKSAAPAKRPPYSARTTKRPVQVWLDSDQRAKIEAAADAEMRPMTQVLILGGLERAAKILDKSR